MVSLLLLLFGVFSVTGMKEGQEFKWTPEYAAQASKTSCKPLQKFTESALKNDIKSTSINRTSLGAVDNAQVCGSLCCEMESCDMAEFKNRHCFAIQCADLKSCDIAPQGDSEILTFTRKTGTDIWTRGMKETSVAPSNKENKTNIVTKTATVQKSSIPQEVNMEQHKDAVISLSSKDKIVSPMDALLKEELEIVHKKEIEKERAWTASNGPVVAHKKGNVLHEKLTSSLGKEIQAITGEHYLKAEDKSDITALQENDTSIAHAKLHQHRRDLRHTLISPITIGAFTCMAVIAVSGFAMAIIKYKKERKDVEDKQTQLP